MLSDSFAPQEERNYHKWEKVLENKVKIKNDIKNWIATQITKGTKNQFSGECAKKRMQDERLAKLESFKEKRIKAIQRVKEIEGIRNVGNISYNLPYHTTRKISIYRKFNKEYNNSVIYDTPNIEEKLEYFNSRFKRTEAIVRQMNESKIRAASMDKSKSNTVRQKIMFNYATMMGERIKKLRKKYFKMTKNVLLLLEA